MDFGGVVAEEGFREGLKAIGRSNGLSPDDFFKKATEIVYSSGYVTGEAEESAYWAALRQQGGIAGLDQDLRREILSRFVLRRWMLDLVRQLRAKGYTVALLSDQTNWLDELDKNHPFFHEFDGVFNSYHLGKSKKDASVFDDVAKELGLLPEEILFIDDNESHVNRALSKGLAAIVYRGKNQLIEHLKSMSLLS